VLAGVYKASRSNVRSTEPALTTTEKEPRIMAFQQIVTRAHIFHITALIGIGALSGMAGVCLVGVLR
jgi:hypothetical protein